MRAAPVGEPIDGTLLGDIARRRRVEGPPAAVETRLRRRRGRQLKYAHGPFGRERIALDGAVPGDVVAVVTRSSDSWSQ